GREGERQHPAAKPDRGGKAARSPDAGGGSSDLYDRRSRLVDRTPGGRRGRGAEGRARATARRRGRDQADRHRRRDDAGRGPSFSPTDGGGAARRYRGGAQGL